jgi:hypothetical protein
METIESRLGRLPLRGPSPDLDRRVLGARPPSARGPSLAGRPLPLWLATAAGAALLLAGFAGGFWIRGVGEPAGRAGPEAPISIQITQGSSGPGNPFDLARPSSPPLSGWKTSVIKG